ncbi:hypothetical protein ACVWWL_000209, partial [Bradyrhizobium sp. USDA 3696]
SNTRSTPICRIHSFRPQAAHPFRRDDNQLHCSGFCVPPTKPALAPPYILRRRIRTKPLARQQTVELIGGKKLPVRSRDRHHKTIHRMLAGQDHRNDRAVTEIHGAAVVFYSFDDECHLAHDHRWHAPIARPATQSRIGENDIADKPAIDPIEPQPYPYWGKQQTGPASRAVRHGYIEPAVGVGPDIRRSGDW